MARRPTVLLGLLGVTTIAAAACADSSERTPSTASEPEPTIAAVHAPACDGTAREFASGYGDVTALEFAAVLTGAEVASWTSSRVVLADGAGIGAPRVEADALRLASGDDVQVCIFTGRFTNAAPPSMSGVDLGPVTEIGLIIAADGTPRISYMHPERAAPVARPDGSMPK